jgi:hypothetical protein
MSTLCNREDLSPRHAIDPELPARPTINESSASKYHESTEVPSGASSVDVAVELSTIDAASKLKVHNAAVKAHERQERFKALKARAVCTPLF